jgi:diacylglycerol kinase (ATP)
VPHAPVIIVNPTAGSGRGRRLVPWLREQLTAIPGAELHVTRDAAEPETLAAAAADRGCERVVAVGGDGTVQAVLNGLLRAARGTELGLLPVGTGNDLARSLGLPVVAEDAWRVAIGPSIRRIDVARARNGEGRQRWFASAGGIGFDAQVAAAMANRRGWQAGRAGYLLTTLAELRRFENRRITMTIDGDRTEHQVLQVAIANGAYYGGGMRIAPDAQPDDGRLDLCVVGNISRLTAIRELPNLYRGTHIRNRAVSMHVVARSVLVEGDAATRVHLDGEPFGGLPLEVVIERAALSVAVPAAALGSTP